jgi:quercetin dioxygenase-like cupin family protein
MSVKRNVTVPRGRPDMVNGYVADAVVSRRCGRLAPRMSESASQPVVRAPGGGLSVSNPVGGDLIFKVMADESGGRMTALETVVAAGQGPPLHVHRDEDEVIYVLEGALRIKLGDELIEAAPGAFAFIPRGVPHTWQSVGAARFFVTVTPASPGFEQLFVRYAELPAEERDVEAFARIAGETEALEVVGPPLARSDPPEPARR